MTEKSQIAIYISLGSLVVAALSFLFSIRQSKIARRNERARVYDKVYHDASDLLLYHYKNEQESTFESEDKDLERAVNEFSNAHWIEQTYGFNFYIPEHIKSEEGKREFCNKVREAYHAHERDKQTRRLDEFINYQSPVFHLENEDFAKRFIRLIKHVTENLSYFSPAIAENLEKTRLLPPDKVKNEHIALKRVNENACETIDEPVEDPYLKLLLCIRHEYRDLNRPFKERWAEFWFNIGAIRYRIKRIFNKKRQ